MYKLKASASLLGNCILLHADLRTTAASSSGVARVPCALGQEIFLRPPPLQQKLQSLN